MKALAFFEELQAKEPQRNVVFTAIEQLTDPTEIRQFLRGYVAWLMAEEKKSLEEAKKIVYGNVGYILGYYGPETIQRWFAVSEEISHPIFGRRIGTVSPEEAFEAGIQLGEELKAEQAKE